MSVLGRSLPAALVQRAGVAIALMAAWLPRRWLVAVAAGAARRVDDGRVSYWAPLQPLFGVRGVVLLLTGLTTRLRGQACCTVPAR